MGHRRKLRVKANFVELFGVSAEASIQPKGARTLKRKQPSAGALWRRSRLVPSKRQRCFGMQHCGIERGKRKIVRSDKQADFGAAENDAVGR